MLCRLCGTPGNPYGVSRSPTCTARPHAKLLHLETGLSQTITECVIRTGRPYRQYTSGPQCRASRSQATMAIEPVISFPGQSLGAIVDVQQDGIISTLLRTQHPGNIDFVYNDPAVPERMAGKVRQGTAVPRHHLRYQLGHNHLALSAKSMQHGAQGVPHTQSAYQDSRPGAVCNPCTSKLPKRFFRPMDATVHEFTIADPDGEFLAPPV